MSITILGIESSCDETSVSVCRDGKILNNIIATQSVHVEYGGVVPELASRAHLRNIIPTLKSCLNASQTPLSEIDAVAYTQGPGLLGALLIANSFSKALAYALDKPIINVNHLKAHILSHFIDEPKPVFPFLCLTISGGHTQIVKISDPYSMEVIGQTQDDAVGEAFDKGAKLIGLSYPGGPLVDNNATKGNSERFTFPESSVDGYDFSFSGIKTALLYFLRDHLKDDPKFIEENLYDICASYQGALVNMLFKKLEKAARQEDIDQIAIAGGVSANSEIRRRLKEHEESHGWSTYIPKFEYCTDNAAMVAMAGFYQYLKKDFGQYTDTPMPRMSF